MAYRWESLIFLSVLVDRGSSSLPEKGETNATESTSQGPMARTN
jgi:hypothetical protein